MFSIRRLHARRALLVVGLAAGGSAVVQAQTASRTAPAATLSLSGGVMGFDASGTGHAPVVALRADRELAGRWALVEGGLAYAPIQEQFSGGRTQLGVAEAQFQAQLPRFRVRPYRGAGLGALAYLTGAGGRDRAEPTISVAGGARAALNQRLGARAELRVRYWQWGGSGFVNGAAEWTLGVSRGF